MIVNYISLAGVMQSLAIIVFWILGGMAAVHLLKASGSKNESNWSCLCGPLLLGLVLASLAIDVLAGNPRKPIK
jgi:hypothetical protein